MIKKLKAEFLRQFKPAPLKAGMKNTNNFGGIENGRKNLFMGRWKSSPFRRNN